jgi:hypothetical protein
LKNKNSLFLLIIINSIFILGEFVIYNRISGLFLGSIIGCLILLVYKSFPLFDYLFKLLLISNLLILIINLFFREYLIIPPLFSAGDKVFEQDIIRNISFGTFNISLRRSTGIIDNIHVSTLLLLYLVFIYLIKQKRVLFLFTSIIFFLTLNFQFILVYLLFFILEKNKEFFKNNAKALFFLVPIIFFIIDFLLLGQAYFYQISNSKFSLLVFELSHYLKYLDFGSFLYGIKPNMIDDPYDALSGYYVPLTDIGLIGVPIQFGFLGVISIFFNVLIGIKYFSKQFKLLFKLLLLTILHYFSLASFLGLLTTYWLSQYYIKIAKK